MLIGILCQVPGCFASAPLLPEDFILRGFLEIWSPRNSLLKFALLNDSLRWNLLFPIFLRDASWPSRAWLCDSIPLSHVPAEWTFSEGNLWTHNFQGHGSFSVPLLRPFAGLPPASACLKWQRSPFLQHVPFRKCLHAFWPFNPEGLVPRGLPVLSRVLPSVWVGVFKVEEDDCALWPELDPWLNLQESPFEHCPVAFHWKQTLPPFFQRWRCSEPSTLFCTKPYRTSYWGVSLVPNEMWSHLVPKFLNVDIL